MAQEQFYIRRAVRQDTEAIRKILNYYIANTNMSWSHSLHRPRDTARIYRSHQFSDRTPLLVSELNGEVIGFAALSFVSNNDGWQEVCEEMIYIHPEYVGRGAGRGLLDAVMEQGFRAGLFAVLAKIDAENEMSLKFHKSFGFEEYGRLKDVGIKGGKRRSCVNLVHYYYDPEKPNFL